MDLGCWLAFLLAFHLLPCLSGNNSSSSTCPENFVCRNLEPLRFPFSNYTHPYCGLCVVDCDTHFSPRIRLDRWSEQWFDVKGMLQSNFIKLHDPLLQNLLDNHNCYSFFYDKYLPNSASISYSIKSNITLFRCFKDHSKERVDHFPGYQKTEPCRGIEVYYKIPKSNGSQFHTGPLPSGCSGMLRPVRSGTNITDKINLFDLLTADFDLEWHLSDECYDCHSKGGQCGINETNQFHCARDETSNTSSGKTKNVKVIIGTCVAVGVLLIVLDIFVTCHKKKKGIKDVLLFLSRNSAEPSPNPDLESGSVFFGVPVFSYAELEEATNNFDVSNELGNGGFGIVYYGRLRDGREVAIKRLYEHNFKRMAQFMNEVEILTRLRHPNLVSIYGCTSRRSRELLLVYEYIPNGTVADHLHDDRAKDQSLTWPVRMNIAIETAGALAYLHASDIIHRDVKTNNILLDHNFEVKVADFGLSRLFPNDVSHISTAPQGTPGYVDPEYHQCYQLTDKSDVYSFGVVLIELISSMPAVDINRHGREVNLANLAINKIQKRALNEFIDQSLGYDSDPEVMRMTTCVAELAFQCVQHEKEMRPAMDEVLETLKAIQGCKENTAESRGRMVPSSPESADVVLLKNKERPSSPNSVTDLFASGSSTNSSSR